MKLYVDTNSRIRAKELCPWAKYIVKAAYGHWCFDTYEAWSEYEFN